MMIIAVRVGLDLGAAKKLVIHNMYISSSFPDFRYSLQLVAMHTVWPVFHPMVFISFYYHLK